VAVIAIVAGFVPITEVPYTATVQYQDTETYYEDEPYKDVETYIETVPLTYEATSYVRDDIVVERCETIIPGLPPMSGEKEVPIKVASVDVRNADDIGGSFTISFSGFSPMFGSPSLTTKLDISPGEVKTAGCPAEYIGNWSYNVTPSTKMIEKERTVTKYRQVEKERPVTKERLETHYKKVPIFEYLLSKL